MAPYGQYCDIRREKSEVWRESASNRSKCVSLTVNACELAALQYLDIDGSCGVRGEIKKNEI